MGGDNQEQCDGISRRLVTGSDVTHSARHSHSARHENTNSTSANILTAALHYRM